LKKMQEMGLKKQLENNLALYEWYSKLKVVALVLFFTIDKCVEYLLDFTVLEYRELADRARYPHLNDFIYDYLLPTWFGRNGRPALFSALMWNHGDV